MRIAVKLTNLTKQSLFEADCYATKRLNALLPSRQRFFSLKQMKALAKIFEIYVNFDVASLDKKASKHEKDFLRIYKASAHRRNYNESYEESVYEEAFNDEELQKF